MHSKGDEEEEQALSINLEAGESNKHTEAEEGYKTPETKTPWRRMNVGIKGSAKATIKAAKQQSRQRTR